MDREERRQALGSAAYHGGWSTGSEEEAETAFPRVTGKPHM